MPKQPISEVLKDTAELLKQSRQVVAGLERLIKELKKTSRGK